MTPNDIWKVPFRAPFRAPNNLQVRSKDGVPFLDIRGWGHLKSKLELSDEEACRLQDEAMEKVVRILNKHWDDPEEGGEG